MHIPPGIIILWRGSIATIPPTFVLCDGNNGTPDLRNKFIIGSGDTYVPGENGGSLNHTHTFTSLFHSHSMPPGSDIQAGASKGNNTTDKVASGTTNNGSSLPPFYSLAYIMKT